ncbi:hypothetical protein DRJ17_01220 [Candidatus Woesearchaeota archaeon]|nr:MAG: hypothetical protein DRJ17_01220 [Candidatus Woesearchaeota archaeon]
MLERIVNSFGRLRKLQSIGSYERSMIEYGLNEVNQHCDSSNTLVLAKRISLFSKDVDDYIRRRARTDLPASQFVGIPERREEFVEIGGVLVYGNNGLIEVRYSSLDVENVRELVELPTSNYPCEFAVPRKTRDDFYGGRPYKTYIETSTEYRVNPEDFNQGDIVIDWHTHPDEGVPSLEDVNSMLKLDGLIGNKKLYSVIYVPRDDQSYWFKIEKAQPKE